MVHGMKYAEYWGAIANHSGDACFDFVYRCDWPNVLNELARHRSKKRREGPIDILREEKATRDGLDDGRVARFLKAVWGKPKLTNAEVHTLMMVAMAASYDPHRDAPNGFRLPINLETGEMLPARWRAWLKHDPINMVQRFGRNLKTLAASSSTAAGRTSTTSTTAREFSPSAWRRPASSTNMRSFPTPTPGSITGWTGACRFYTGR